MQVHLANTFEMAYKEGVLAQELARRSALHVPLTKGRVVLLDERHLLTVQLDELLAVFLFQQQPAVVPAAHLVAVEDLLDRYRTEANPF
ncbi:MAG: hypothetical protein BWY10_02581 [Chloroflexi bacterium ADurb.Bin180]|nr:MAG: hypothetical protein BWY10_02581 [Chloroflexi bacterium ADurb.Bin180]